MCSHEFFVLINFVFIQKSKVKAIEEAANQMGIEKTYDKLTKGDLAMMLSEFMEQNVSGSTSSTFSSTNKKRVRHY